MKPYLLAALIALGLITARPGSAEPALTAKAAFDKLKTLAGDWRGTIDKKDGDEINVSYRTTSNGTVVMETLFAGTDHEMVTLYYVEADKLVLIHYCAMGNQPKMALTKASTADQLVFDFVGGDNVKPKKDTHMHSARIRFDGKDAVIGEWDTFKEGKKAGTHTFFLSRKS